MSYLTWRLLISPAVSLLALLVPHASSDNIILSDVIQNGTVHVEMTSVAANLDGVKVKPGVNSTAYEW